MASEKSTPENKCKTDCEAISFLDSLSGEDEDKFFSDMENGEIDEWIRLYPKGLDVILNQLIQSFDPERKQIPTGTLRSTQAEISDRIGSISAFVGLIARLILNGLDINILSDKYNNDSDVKTTPILSACEFRREIAVEALLWIGAHP